MNGKTVISNSKSRTGKMRFQGWLRSANHSLAVKTPKMGKMTEKIVSP
jgi:hypothetical protein